ncbi:hypothetical protein N0V91_009793 [Didymella pomorum]|uniref:Uncharacterized protein n=1 Tax=Didymella pomorum TaxID=749634 RepID=A0A9W8Z6A7_9PLEO|nr:hypothetical protein N0V91_009793 [Didymella pomorum]
MVDPLKATKVCDKRKYMEMMERATSQSDEKRRTFALGSEIVTAHAYLGSQVPPPTKKEITHHEIHRDELESQEAHALAAETARRENLSREERMASKPLKEYLAEYKASEALRKHMEDFMAGLRGRRA